MAQADVPLEDEDEDVNLSLLNFYQGNLHFLMQVSLHQIPNKLKFDAAAWYYETSEFKDEWIEVMEELGVEDTTIIGLDFKSRQTGDFPIYLALNGVLKSNRSFGDFIYVLCRKKKFRILLKLKPFVSELLANLHSLSDEGLDFGPHPSAPDFSALSITSSLTDVHNPERSHSANQDVGNDSVTCQENGIKHANSHRAAMEHFQNSGFIPLVNKKKLSVISNSCINQSIDDLISIFIMHSMLDKKYAKKLAACLDEKNFRVITSANIHHYLRRNPTLIMKLVNEKVDFVIPVLSESFMTQIKLRGYNTTEEEKDIEIVANTFMYDCLLNEYSKNFINRRVRPVCYSLEGKKLKNNDQILSWPYYLPYNYLRNDQFLEFLKLLRHDKKCIKN